MLADVTSWWRRSCVMIAVALGKVANERLQAEETSRWSPDQMLRTERIGRKWRIGKLKKVAGGDDGCDVKK